MSWPRSASINPFAKSSTLRRWTGQYRNGPRVTGTARPTTSVFAWAWSASSAQDCSSLGLRRDARQQLSDGLLERCGVPRAAPPTNPDLRCETDAGAPRLLMFAAGEILAAVDVAKKD